MRALRRVDIDWLDSAPHRIEVSAELPRSRERVFEVLAAAEPWPQWLRIVRKITYLTDEPYGVGTQRDALGASGTIREHFFRWDEPAGFSFYVRETSVMGLTAFIEDYALEAISDHSCRLTWRTAFEVAWWARPFGGLSRRIFAREAQLGLTRLASWLEAKK